jgi:hypothetical protein
MSEESFSAYAGVFSRIRHEVHAHAGCNKKVLRGLGCSRPDRPAHRGEISRRAVAGPRQRCVSAFSGRHLSRRARTETGGHLPLLRVPEGLTGHLQPDGVAPFGHDPPLPRLRGRVRGFARSRIRCRERGLTQRSGERRACRCRSKNRDGILPRFPPSPDPRLHLHRPACRGARCGDAERPDGLTTPVRSSSATKSAKNPKKAGPAHPAPAPSVIDQPLLSHSRARRQLPPPARPREERSQSRKTGIPSSTTTRPETEYTGLATSRISATPAAARMYSTGTTG